MKILSILKKLRPRKKEKIEEKKEEKVVTRKPSLLKRVCDGDEEAYEALREALAFKRPSDPVDELLKKASASEEAGDPLGIAGQYYRTLGQISLADGDIEGVKGHFKKAQELTGKRYSILEIPERAVSKAKEYYQKIQAEKTEKTEQTKH